MLTTAPSLPHRWRLLHLNASSSTVLTWGRRPWPRHSMTNSRSRASSRSSKVKCAARWRSAPLPSDTQEARCVDWVEVSIFRRVSESPILRRRSSYVIRTRTTSLSTQKCSRRRRGIHSPRVGDGVTPRRFEFGCSLDGSSDAACPCSKASDRIVAFARPHDIRQTQLSVAPSPRHAHAPSHAARELFVRPRARLCCPGTSPGKAPRRSLAAARHTISSVERSS